MTATVGPIARSVHRKADYIQNLFKDLHRFPETAGTEEETTNRIIGELTAHGVNARVSATGAGVIAEIGPRGDGPVIAARADIDALDVAEDNDLPWRSRRPGKMHACGHDAMASGLVGAAVTLQEMNRKEPFPYKLRLIWQGSEETAKGAAAMIVEDGVLDNVYAIYGAHAWVGNNIGEIAIREGTVQYSCEPFVAKLHGRAGHTSRVDKTGNIVSVGGRIPGDLEQWTKNRYSDMSMPPILGFGFINSGKAANAVPSTMEMGGTIRCPTHKTYQNSSRELREEFHRMVADGGLRGELNITGSVPPLINTPWAVEQVVSGISTQLGRAGLKEFPGSPGADDMALYGTGLPGHPGSPEICYAQIGSTPVGVDAKKKMNEADLHTPQFYADPKTAVMAGTYYASVLAQGLSGHPGRGRDGLVLAK